MNADSAVSMLLDRFPSLSDPMRAYIDAWMREGEDLSSPGPYNLFGDVFFPRLIEPLLTREPEDAEGLDCLFDAIEVMATEGDEEVRTLVCFGICERLGDSPVWLKRARSHMGERTLAFSKAVEVQWGRGP